MPKGTDLSDAQRRRPRRDSPRSLNNRPRKTLGLYETIREARRASCAHPLNPPTLHGRICELENGTVLAPSALDPWMDSAYFERAIFSLGNRVDVSVRARLFSGGTRRAIELRDRICTHPYCYEPAE